MTDRLTSILTGSWWKFDRYELRDGMIRPARGANFSQYDPWEYLDPDVPVQQDRVPAYRSLISIVNRLRYLDEDSRSVHSRLHPNSERELLDWCGQNGLLGILPHDAVLITLAPRIRKVSAADYRMTLEGWRRAGSNEQPPRTMTLQKSYSRTTFGWAENDRRIVRNSELRSPTVVTQSLTGDTLSEQSMIMLKRYFSSDLRSDDQWENFECPPPLSERFWKLYAEPLDRFVQRVGFLQLAIASMTASKSEEPASRKAVERRAGRDYLQGLLSPVGLGYAVDPEFGLRPRLMGGSLLAALAAMALQDVPKGRVLQCAVCGSIFIAGNREQTRYCSKRCRATAQKRAVRQREKANRGG